jgi:hypothetical protein
MHDTLYDPLKQRGRPVGEKQEREGFYIKDNILRDYT